MIVLRNDASAALQNPTDVLPRFWLNREHVRVGASLLAILDPPSGKVPLRREVFSRMPSSFQLSDEQPTLSSSNAKEYLGYLETFHSATLKTLCSLQSVALGPTWAHHRPYWAGALNRLSHDGVISPITGAKLIANRITTGNLTAPQLVHVARSELNADWTKLPGLYKPLGDLIASLSSKGTSTEKRLLALANFRRPISHTPDRWSLVEDAILHQIYTWPLLVLQAPGCPEKDFTLPVAIDVFLNGEARSPFRGDGIIDCVSWEKPLERALAAAKALWMNKHLAWPPEFRKAIANATVVVDVTAAEEIIRPYLRWASFGLTGDSAELYLTLVILASFLNDRAAIETTCATGILGDPRPDPEGGGDNYMVEPWHLEVKFEGAQNAGLFDTMLIATKSNHIKSTGHLRVCTGKLLSEFADHVFGQSYRKNQFVRAADLAAAYRSEIKKQRKYQRHQYDHEVDKILNDLRENDSNPVFQLDPSFKAESVARALRRVNDRAAEAFPDAPKEQVGSFAFIRVVPDEINERFWQVVWDVIKGSAESFFDFRFRTSRTEPAKILAAELNKICTPGNPVRAPDVLVIVGSNHLHRSVSDIPSGPFSRLQLQHMLGVLRKELQRTRIEGVAQQIGKTRIILVPEDQTPTRELVAQPKNADLALDADLADAVKRLSVFRFGFTFQMARHLLGLPDDACKAVLDRLTRTQYGGKSYLRFGHGAAEYFLQLQIDQWEGVNAAELHYAAANAIVGFLSPADLARFDFQEALTPAWLHEAQWQLRQAMNLGEKYQTAYRAHERLSRIGEVFGWTRIRYASRSREDGEELLEAIKEHFEKVKGLGWPKYRHPIEFVFAAKFAHHLSRRREGSELDGAAQLEALRLDWNQYFRWADEACDDLGPEERGACRYVIATSRACMVMSEARNGDGLKQAAKDIQVASQLSQYEGELLDIEWFEFMGDREFDNARAAEVYRLGIVNTRIGWLRRPQISLAIKYLASARMANSAHPCDVVDRLRLMARPQKFIPHDNKKSGLGGLTWVQERWRIGRKMLLGGDFDFPTSK